MATNLSENSKYNSLITTIGEVLEQGKAYVLKTVNQGIVQTYWSIGKHIVEFEQAGNKKAQYGSALLKRISSDLTCKYGKGFSVDNLENMRRFYITYATLPKSETLSRKCEKEFQLSWSHYVFLIHIDNETERNFYEKEAINQNWSLRELKRQFNSALFERLALSKNKEEIIQLSKQGQIISEPQDIVKDPLVLEFLGLPEQVKYSESELEQRIIDKLQLFLMELGKGYTFVGRQVRLTFNEKHFFVDLVFFNRILQCFVLIDLKIGEISHQDLGQMQMYVNYYDRKVKLENENATIGIVLCKKKDDTLVELTLPENNSQIFASKYQTVLPNKEELAKLLEQ